MKRLHIRLTIRYEAACKAPFEARLLSCLNEVFTDLLTQLFNRLPIKLFIRLFEKRFILLEKLLIFFPIWIPEFKRTVIRKEFKCNFYFQSEVEGTILLTYDVKPNIN